MRTGHIAPFLGLAAAIAFASPTTGQVEYNLTPPSAELPSDAVMVHEGSGFRFPAQLAGFERDPHSWQFRSGEFAGIRYRRRIGMWDSVIVEIILTQAGEMSPKNSYVALKDTALRGMTGVQLISEAPYIPRGDGQLRGYRGTFRVMDIDRPTLIVFATINDGLWTAQVRAKYPVSDQEASAQAVEELLSSLTAQRVSPVKTHH